MKQLLVGMLLMLILNGCGQKGPLVLPPEGADTPQAQAPNKDKK